VPFVTVLTPCFNEEGNVREVHRRVADAMGTLPGYDYQHLFIDNASVDGTVSVLRELAAEDPHVGVIVNVRNFGHVRSPYYGLLHARGDAVVSCVADLQDPPEMIPDFVRKWEQGYKIVIGTKSASEEAWLMFRIRRLYYRVIARLADSEVDLVSDFTGFGLYDREVIENLRSTEEQYPYFRGLICDFGYERAELDYVQPARKKGRTKNSFYTLYDLAMVGIVNHSKVPLRIATIVGFALSIVSLVVAAVYLVLKLAFWNDFGFGLAPLLIGIYFFGSVQLFFVGVLGEYVGSIHTQVHRRPLVVERERINFPPTSPEPAGSTERAEHVPSA
jgi:polyisoprenyl-phosphate glycosyltransferase